MLSFESIAAKVREGKRLHEDDALFLFEHPDLLAIGKLADEVNWRKNHGQVYYNVNRHINPTNICALSCKFCAFSRKPGEPGAYAYTIEEMVAKAQDAVNDGATEVHMVGGLHPRWPFQKYLDMIAAIRKEFPDLHIKAFTAVELDWMARKARLSLQEVLEQLRAAGLSSLPGGGAEIFHPEIRDQICDTKVSADQWIGTHRLAHSLGIRSNCTMLYGHIEEFRHRVDHMARLRALQDETNGFNVFIPLAFQPYENELGIGRYTFGYDDLKTIAVARLFLDNFRNIKAYWIMAGQDIAQLALTFGANDVDGTVKEEKISRMAGGRAGNALSRQEIEGMISKMDRVAIERDTLYRPVRAADADRIARQPEPLALSNDQALVLRSAPTANLISLAAAARATSIRQSGNALTLGFFPAVTLTLTQLTGAAEESLGKTLDDAKLGLHHALGQTGDLGVVLAASAPETEAPTLEAVQQGMARLRQLLPKTSTVAFAGFSSLLNMAKGAGAKNLESCGRALRDLGIGLVLPAPQELMVGLTPTEIANIHLAMHQADIPTVGRIEIPAKLEAQGGSILWELYQEQLWNMARMADGHAGILAVEISTSASMRVSVGDYFRALAMARVVLHNIPHIIAPHDRIPVLSPTSGYAVATKSHPSEKVMALAAHWGASDIGVVDPGAYDLSAIASLANATGCQWRARSMTFHTILTGKELVEDRHFPKGRC